MNSGERFGSDRFEGISGGDIARLLIALAVVASAGWALGHVVQDLPTPSVSIGEPEPAIMIDLAPPVPVETAVPTTPETLPELETEPPLEPIETETVAALEAEEPPPPVEPEAVEPLPEIVEPLPAPPPEPVAELPPEPVAPLEAEPEVVEALPELPMPVTMSAELQRQRENTPALPRPTPPPRPTAQPAAQPRPQPSAPASAPAASTVSPQQWQAQALQRLDSRKVYPPQARDNGEQGVVVIGFSVNARGQVTSVGISRSSGSSVLDQAALETARRASPLPAPPAELANRPLTANIRFSLR